MGWSDYSYFVHYKQCSGVAVLPNRSIKLPKLSELCYDEDWKITLRCKLEVELKFDNIRDDSNKASRIVRIRENS